ncbi:MAG TPA: peptidylprolyl isomerase [Acetivibrio sp.]|mgnify:CR=1 FL=1|uniref:peptidylprolyl isomerase n=1 Tax=Acetivibrio sp. TaxID=1872092 RepID=UPI002BAFD46B|nr:peptidylprolyl isomerase [Acetivibrio sp.]HOM01717.1 peptidylprolyl isomerase [Acetivibrio sp.]
MKKAKSIILVVSIVVVLIAGLSAATYFLLKPMFQKDGGSNSDYSISTSPLTKEEANKVIAEVNGEKILYKEFYFLYSQQAAYYGLTDEDSLSDDMKEMLKTIKNEILTQLIQQEIAKQKAKEAGYTVTDEKLAEAKESFDKMIEDIAEQLKMANPSEAETTDFVKQAKDYVNSELDAMKISMDEYIEQTAEYMLVTEFMESITKDIDVTDEEIRKYYDEQLKVQKDNPDEAAYASIQLIQPASSRVKHILIGLSDEVKNKYNSLKYEEGKTEEAEAYLNEKLEEIKPKAQDVLNKAKNGEDFEALIKEFGEDPGMESEEYKDGYTVSKNSGFIESFEEASLALGEGEISDLVPGPYGYHIIKVYEKTQEKPYTLEEKKSEIKEMLQSDKKSTFMDEKMKEWENASTIVRHDDLL